MVQRYDVWCIEDIFKNSADGSYVKYEDYAKLEAKLREFAEQVLYAPCSKVTEEMAREILGI